MTRISELPRRDWRQDADAAVRELTAALRTPTGSQTLHPIQAAGIWEGVSLDFRLLCNANVGEGKTLMAALLATLAEQAGHRVLTVVPGGFEDKTHREIGEYRKHWQISETLQIVTYNDISRDVDERLLRGFAPTRLVCDESSKLRRLGGSGVANRVWSYMAATPEAAMMAFDGTMFKDGVKDFWHILKWCLKEGSPLPLVPAQVEQWHRALNGNDDCAIAMLEALGERTDTSLSAAFQRRLFETPGIIVSTEVFRGVPLTIETWEADTKVDGALSRMRETGETPDGEPAVLEAPDHNEDPFEAAEAQLALGFYYHFDPPPPRDWTLARRAWFRFVRARLLAGRYKTELQVRRAVLRGELNDDGRWEAWDAIRRTFEPKTVPVWLGDEAIRLAATWGRDGGIVWVDHRAFAERLSSYTGWRWFEAGGVDSTGLPIEICKDKTVIASRKANGTGRNLQRWSRALVTRWPSNGRDAEQLIGRIHRPGQTQPCYVTCLLACSAHRAALCKSIELSEAEHKQVGRLSKVLFADWQERK